MTQVTLREGPAAENWLYRREVSYNGQGLPTREKVTYPAAVTFTTQTEYDAYLRPATLIYQDGERLEAEYNGMGLVKKLSVTPSGGSKVTLVDSISYNEAGLLTALRMVQGGTVWRKHLYYPWNNNMVSADSNARLQEIRVGTSDNLTVAASHNILRLGYGYEGFGNVTLMGESVGGSPLAAPAFSYDAQSRLSGAYGGSYGFDGANRMTGFEGRSLGYGGTQPHAVSSSVQSGTPSLAFRYDANGNMTQREYLDAGTMQMQTLVWDNVNRLRTVTQGGATETYWYDEGSTRVRKQVAGVMSYTPNRYHEREGATTTQYYYLGTMPIALRTGTNYTYLHTDALGSVVATTQGATVTGSRLYRAYGAKRSGGDFPFARNYTGQEMDDTGLLYYGARYYDPTIGRFVSPDTLIPDPTQPLDYNRYLYGRGNPLKYNDPTGHCPVPPSEMGATICMALFIKPEHLVLSPVNVLS